MRRVIQAVGLFAVFGLVMVGLVAPPASAATFYDPPSDLPSADGALVRTEPMKLGASLSLPGMKGPLPATATRLMYKSTDAGGQPVAVTGTYMEPTKDWTGSGPRPLVSLSVGTQGQGDACAPSKSFEKILNVEGGQFGIGYEIPNAYEFLNRGIAVVVTDYVGLGTTDRVHTYTNRVDMGHAVLDAARAALNLQDTSVTEASPVGLYGYSQGGGASAAAVELAASYAPELNLKGAYAGAPPADLLPITKSADGTALTGVIAYAINGIAPYHPEVQPILDAETTDAGKKALDAVSKQCIGGTIASYAFQKTSKWTTSGKSAYDLVSSNPTLVKAVEEQRIGRIKPTVPVQVLTGTKDDIVDHGQAKQLAKDWCALGANVTYVPVIQPLSSAGTSLNHITPMIARLGPSHAWLVDRLQDKPVTSTCGSVATQP